MTQRSLGLALIALSSLAMAAGASAQDLDWSQHADVSVIEIITVDADGDVRETKVWFVLSEGAAYLRTNGTRWLANIERNPNVVVRIEGHEFPQRVQVVPGLEIIERVDAASRKKYGWQEAMIRPFRMQSPDILKLSPPAES